MYMLCDAHNLETNKMLYSWFVSLFLFYFLVVVFFFAMTEKPFACGVRQACMY